MSNLATSGGATHWEREIEALRAKLAEVERERDEFKHAHLSQVAYTQDLIAAYEVERDEARRWAAVWKRLAKRKREYLKMNANLSVKYIARSAIARDIMELLVDDYSCRFNHHGICQEHAATSGGICVNKMMQDWLGGEGE